MASLKYLHWTPAHPPSVSPHPARKAAVVALHAASAALARAARRLAQPAAPRKAVADPRLEFYAEAGAPEGALYLDGRLVGHLQGVNRL